MKRKIYLPEWQKYFIPPVFGVIWLFITYRHFFSGDTEMSTVEYLIMTVVFLGVAVLVWFMASGKLPVYEIVDENVASQKQKNINPGTELTPDEQRIMDFVEKQGSVKNDDIENLLDVADSTATLYLNELVEKGKLVQKGEGKGTYYEKL